MYKVFVGVGHGGSDPGACANGLRECDIALDIALETQRILEEHGVTTKISRTNQGTDDRDDLVPKINRCNTFAPDLAVDIHINAGGGVGWESYHYSGGGKSKTLAENIEKEIISITNSRGLKTKLNATGSDYFGWIRQVSAPSVILEAGFIDNTEDVQKFKDIEGRKKFGICYAKGILATLGIPYNQNNVEGQENSEMKRYNTLDEIPEGEFRNTIGELMNKGIIKGGTDGKLDLSHDMIRMLVINNRAGVYK